jgi:hypothetical protein
MLRQLIVIGEDGPDGGGWGVDHDGCRDAARVESWGFNANIANLLPKLEIYVIYITLFHTERHNLIIGLSVIWKCYWIVRDTHLTKIIDRIIINTHIKNFPRICL